MHIITIVHECTCVIRRSCTTAHVVYYMRVSCVTVVFSTSLLAAHSQKRLSHLTRLLQTSCGRLSLQVI